MLSFLLFAGHTDHSEDNLSAPLLSISLGQPAIFLIGGSSLATVPAAILLRSGDVLLMERESRLAYPNVCKRALTSLLNILQGTGSLLKVHQAFF